VAREDLTSAADSDEKASLLVFDRMKNRRPSDGKSRVKTSNRFSALEEDGRKTTAKEAQADAGDPGEVVPEGAVASASDPLVQPEGAASSAAATGAGAAAGAAAGNGKAAAAGRKNTKKQRVRANQKRSADECCMTQDVTFAMDKDGDPERTLVEEDPGGRSSKSRAASSRRVRSRSEGPGPDPDAAAGGTPPSVPDSPTDRSDRASRVSNEASEEMLPQERRLDPIQAATLAVMTARLCERALADRLRATSTRAIVVAALVDGPVLQGKDVLELDIGSLAHCEAVDSSTGWGFGTIVAPLRLSGTRGCFPLERLQAVVVQQLGNGGVQCTPGNWQEVDKLNPSSGSQHRLRQKAMLNRMRAAREDMQQR
jgi:hypothetical protein